MVVSMATAQGGPDVDDAHGQRKRARLTPHEELAALLREHGGLIVRIARQNSLTDRLGQTALHQVAGRGWADVVAHLLERGANPAPKDMMGRTPLVLATTPVQGRAVPNGERIAETLKSATGSRP